MVYPASYPPPPLDAYAGGVGKTIAKLMGGQTSPLEHFIVKRKLMGPQWVRIKNPNLEGTAASWCKIEARYHYITLHARNQLRNEKKEFVLTRSVPHSKENKERVTVTKNTNSFTLLLLTQLLPSFT